MNLIRRNPYNDLAFLQNQFNHLFESAFQSWPGEATVTNGWVPSADTYETDNDVVVTMDLPGVDPKEVEVRVENNVLTIRGERRFSSNMETENFHRVERPYGPFARSFTLTIPVDSDRVLANYRDGVLRIALPKA